MNVEKKHNIRGDEGHGEGVREEMVVGIES